MCLALMADAGMHFLFFIAAFHRVALKADKRKRAILRQVSRCENIPDFGRGNLIT